MSKNAARKAPDNPDKKERAMLGKYKLKEMWDGYIPPASKKTQPSAPAAAAQATPAKNNDGEEHSIAVLQPPAIKKRVRGGESPVR